MQPTLFLMLGYPEAGKTTTAKAIHELTGAVHLWADYERRARFGNPSYTHTENITLYTDLNKKAETTLAEGKSVIFDTNFRFYKDRKHLRDIASSHGVKTVVVWVQTPLEIARQRAVDEAHKHSTRVLGHMPLKTFQRTSNNIQPPKSDEEVVIVDGTKVSPQYLRELLHLANGTK